MREFIDRFSLESIKFDAQVGIALVVIWLLVLGCATTSILQRYPKTHTRLTWLAIVYLVPVLGLLIYLPFAFHLEKYPDLLIWRKPGGKSKA